MEWLTVSEIEKAVGGSASHCDTGLSIDDVTCDSRTVRENSLFVPLAGKNADGHDFIGKAVTAGARIVLTAREVPEDLQKKACFIRVDDTLSALGRLAACYLRRIHPKVVAVTGSVGKTSTKEMLASVLSQKYRTLKTQGNFNNNIGLPLTIFRLKKDDEMAVLEMGMNHFGEIRALSQIAPPDAAVFTNIGLSHIENLGSREGILKAKLEMLENLKPEGCVILNKDNDMLEKASQTIPYPVISYGIYGDGLHFQAKNVELTQEGVTFETNIYGEPSCVRIHALGEYNVYNALCAIAAGEHFGVGREAILRGIAEYTCADMRMNIEKTGRYTIIADCYNAAPDSMNEALRVLASLENPRKVAVLGDMLEMGDYAVEAHRNVGVKASECAGVLVCVGSHAKEIAKGALQAGMNANDVYSFDNNDNCKKELAGIVKSGDAVLFKASRAMRFEELAAFLKDC